MALLETHVRPVRIGIGASGLFRLASMEGSPGKLSIVVPSVKKSTYFKPTTCTSLSAGLLLTEEASCDEPWPRTWLVEEVAEEAVDVALSMRGATVVDVAVVEAVTTSAAVLDAVEEGVELAVSGGAIAASASVDVALVDVAVSAATIPALKVPTMMKLVRRTLAAENAIVWAFIKLR
jgi:hypothetical protein